jgi:tyrosinase
MRRSMMFLAVAIGTPPGPGLALALRYRRRLARLSKDQLALLREGFTAVKEISDDRGYTYFAGIHGLPLPIGCRFAHGTPYFLPWHRAYLHAFERAIRDRVAGANLTWWAWGTMRPGQNPGVPTAFAQKQVGGKANPLYDARIDPLARQQAAAQGQPVPARTWRRPNAPGVLPLPIRDEIRRTLLINDFLDFSAQLEELHGRVHVWVGGSMRDIRFAAFDPIFWAHHTMIDRLWRVWQLRHPNASPPASILDDPLPPFEQFTVRRTLDVTQLGYDYAETTRSTTVV